MLYYKCYYGDEFGKLQDIYIMEKSLNQYTRWLSESLPADLREELENIKSNDEEIYDRFCRDMTFGTSGLRGRMGAGCI